MVRTRHPRWHGRISQEPVRRPDGHRAHIIEIYSRSLLERWLAKHAGEFASVLIEPAKRSRSLRQNDYWWSCVVPAFAEACKYQDWEHELVHEELLRVLLGTRPDSHPLLPLRFSSRELSTVEFNRLIEAAQMFGAEKLGIVIEDPDPLWALKRTRHARKAAALHD